MPTNVHSRLTDEEIHIPFRQVFPDTATKDADSTAYESYDINKLCYVVDTQQIFVLTNISPVTWSSISVNSLDLQTVLSSGNETGGNDIIITSGDKIFGESATTIAGDVTIRGGTATGAGPIDGGDIILRPGAETGGGVDGTTIFRSADGLSSVKFEATNLQEITIGTTYPLIYNGTTGKLTVPGFIDPTAIIFEQAAAPTTLASEGALFVSDGSSSLQSGMLYYKGENDQAPYLVQSVLDDGGNIGGTYHNDVICIGDITANDNIIVYGNLIVHGNFTNSDRYSLDVYGDLIVNGNMDFENGDLSQAQSPIDIKGNMTCSYLNYKQSGGTESSITVGGNLTSSYNLDLYGISVPTATISTSGADLTVYGNLTCYSINASGGSEIAGSSAGNGSTITVKGNMILNGNLEANGGGAGPGTPGLNAGNGGVLNVRGSVFCNAIDMNGGTSDSDSGNAGDGGQINIFGELNLSALYLNGGECYSIDENSSAGHGGDLTVEGDFNCEIELNLNGGYRSCSSPTVSSSSVPPNGGSIVCKGNAFIRTFEVNGGQVTSTAENCTGGDGGSVTIRGNLNVWLGTSKINGGDCDQNNGGKGGEITVNGLFNLHSTLQINGGNSTFIGKYNGSAGSAYFYGGITASNFEALDGITAGGVLPPLDDVRILLSGNCNFGELNVVDRAESWIYTLTSRAPTILGITSMSDKTTLNTSGGLVQPDISGYIGDSYFICPNGTWLRVQGSAL